MKRRSFLAGLSMAAVARPSFAGPRWHMPAEEARHARTFMQWPVDRRVHPDAVFLDMLQTSIADVANTIAEFEPVVMLMAAEHEASARRKLSDMVEIWDIPTNDLWARDSSPVFVKRGAEDAVMSLNFNGWGGKQPHIHDAQIAARIAYRLGLPLLDSGVLGEAGGLESDGHGTLIAHESSWVNPNRNPDLTRTEIETRLLRALGADRMVWAPGVSGADITDYHIDSLARFSAPGTIVIQMPEAVDPADPWSVAAFETFDILKTAGFTMEVIPEPYDTRVTDADFVASYVNYYVCNGAVICAAFGDRQADEVAVDTLRRLYPERDVIALDVDPIGEVGGGIHCATQQQPA